MRTSRWEIDRGPSIAQGEPYWLMVARWVLTCGFLLLVLVGLQPMSTGSLADRVKGSPLDRVVVITLFAIALCVIWKHRPAAFACLRENWVIVAVVGFALFSTIWSDYPYLTFRRATQLALVTAIAIAVAISAAGPRQAHTLLYSWLIAVMALNLVMIAIWPSSSISGSGAQGIYTNKNTAGQIAMITAIIGATWMISTRNVASVIVGIIGLMMAFTLLLLSSSKTSIGLTLVALVVVAVFPLSVVLGERFVLLIWFMGLVGILSLIGLFVWNDFDLVGVLATAIADKSFTGRDALWAFAWKMANERPWGGYGYGAFWDVGEANDPLVRVDPGTWLGDVEKGAINQAHNGYLELWLNIGLPATIVVIVTLAYWLVRDFRCIKTAASREIMGLHCATGVIIFVFVLHNITEATLFLPALPLYNIVVLLRSLVVCFGIGRRLP
jgi:exopolysaccharide production protein ExoQ